MKESIAEKEAPLCGRGEKLASMKAGWRIHKEEFAGGEKL